MKALFTMWKYPKMVLLVFVSALLYAVTLIPFKGFELIPGIAELRPAALFPPVLGILFGPAGAWGCAIGNTIGDYFGGTLTKGSYFGAAGNFCFALVASFLWNKGGSPETAGQFNLASSQDWIRYVMACVLACAAVAFIISWGLEFLQLSSFASIGSIILLNNLAASLILGPFLFKLFLSRSKAWGFFWLDIMSPSDRSQGYSPKWSTALLWLGAAGGLAVGLFISHVFYQNAFLEAEVFHNDPAVLLSTAPFLALFALGCILD